jgi:hypothetical protein
MSNTSSCKSALPCNIREFPDKVVRPRITAGRHTNILIIGGGLTSAQYANPALRKGVGAVWHMMRGPLPWGDQSIDRDETTLPTSSSPPYFKVSQLCQFYCYGHENCIFKKAQKQGFQTNYINTGCLSHQLQSPSSASDLSILSAYSTLFPDPPTHQLQP